MQYFGPEISQFGGFFKMQFAHRRSPLHISGIIVVHPVDVRPNLDFFGTEDRAQQRGGVVAASALQIVHMSGGVAANVALSQV